MAPGGVVPVIVQAPSGESIFLRLDVVSPSSNSLRKDSNRSEDTHCGCPVDA